MKKNYLMLLIFLIGTFGFKSIYVSNDDLRVAEPRVINAIIIEYAKSVEVLLSKLPKNEQYLIPLMVSCDYIALNKALEKIVLKKNDAYLFIQRNGNSIISALSHLIVQVFNAYKDKKVDFLSDLEEMTFSSLIKSLERTGFFAQENRGIAPLIELNSLQDILKNNLTYTKNNLKASPQLDGYLKKMAELDRFLRGFFEKNYDQEKSISSIFEQIELSKKGLIVQALDANARAGDFIIKTGVNAVGAIGMTLADTARVKAFENELIAKIEANYKNTMTLYRQKIHAQEETLADLEKYLAWLFVQFDFNTLYLYEKPEDRLYVEKIVGFLKGKEIQTKINKYIKVFLLGIIRQFEQLIERGYRYHITNVYDPETGRWSFSLSDKEKKAYSYLYEFAKDVLAYQMAIKEVDKELTTLKTLSDTIIKYIKSDAIQEVSKEKQKAFLEPLYQIAYFFKIIELKNFDYETILSLIKTKMPDVVAPNDPDLKEKYIPFIPLFISRRLPAPVFWLSQWGFGLVKVATQYSLLYVLKQIYPDISVDATKSQDQQIEEAGRKFVKIKAKPFVRKFVPERIADPIADKIAATVLGSVKEQYEEAFSSKRYEKSGLVRSVQEQPKSTSSPINGESQAPTTEQTSSSQKSFFGRLQDYVASWFSWMWAQ